MDNQSLIPGLFKERTNSIIHYSHVISVFVTLFLILIITAITASTIHDVSKASSETRKIILDMNLLMPQAQMGVRIISIMCSDKNFTQWYPKYAAVIC